MHGGEPSPALPRDNQYTAEQTFGAGFMQRKREETERSRTEKRKALGDVRVMEAIDPRDDGEDIVPWLRTLGYRADQAQRAARHCDQMPEWTTLEERVKAALRFLAPPHRHVAAAG